MGLMDKLKGMLGQHPDKVDDGVTKAGDAIDDRTGSTYSEHVDKGQDAARDALGGTPDSGDAR
jgi:hypothetical protein